MLITELNKDGSLREQKPDPKIQKLQQILTKAGYIVKVSGVFDEETTIQVKKFQKAHGLTVDGVVGKNTLYELMFYAYDDFVKSEFKCKCGKYCNGFPVGVDEDLLVMLQKIRDHFGKPVYITSAIRCTQHNKNVGGATKSQHLYGTAADIKVSGVSASTVYAYCDKINPNGGVGKYNTFTHIDVRSGKARWNG